MTQWLPRGYEVLKGLRVRKLIAEGNTWQIFITGSETYVLVVEDELFDQWSRNNDVPNNLFFKIDDEDGRYVFASKPGYLISSLEIGPFPSDNHQIEAFAIAFSTAMRLGQNVAEALYIEEYSMVLPTQQGKDCDYGLVFGKWLTGGVGVSIEAFSTVERIMTWMPEAGLKHAALTAGFDAKDDDDVGSEPLELIEGEIVQTERMMIPEERFKLSGRPDLEKFLNDNIIDVLRQPEAYRRMGIDFPGATILYGPPGCGKTYAIDRLAEYLGWERFDINSSSIGSPYIHETGRLISNIFDTAIENAPSILVIDEMEAYLSKRDTREMHRVEETAEFLRKIPEAVSKGVLVFAMTNMIDSIDPAILRRGRFDYSIEIKMATKEEIKDLLIEQFENLPIDKEVKAEMIAKLLEGRPLSDITFVLREAGRHAVKEGLSTINIQCINYAVDLLPTQEKEKRTIGF